jgi:hypothetical protein
MFGAAFAKANSSTTTPRLKLGCSAGPAPISPTAFR